MMKIMKPSHRCSPLKPIALTLSAVLWDSVETNQMGGRASDANRWPGLDSQASVVDTLVLYTHRMLRVRSEGTRTARWNHCQHLSSCLQPSVCKTTPELSLLQITAATSPQLHHSGRLVNLYAIEQTQQ